MTLGLGGKLVQLISHSVFANTVSVPATATFTLSSGGGASDSGGFSYGWLLSGSGASYEVMATLQGSTTLTLGGSVLGAWLNLGTTRSWGYTKTGVGEDTADLLIQIRPVGGSPIASCVEHFDCTVN
jgi:hypothetical protein